MTEPEAPGRERQSDGVPSISVTIRRIAKRPMTSARAPKSRGPVVCTCDIPRSSTGPRAGPSEYGLPRPIPRDGWPTPAGSSGLGRDVRDEEDHDQPDEDRRQEERPHHVLGPNVHRPPSSIDPRARTDRSRHLRILAAGRPIRRPARGDGPGQARTPVAPRATGVHSAAEPAHQVRGGSAPALAAGRRPIVPRPQARDVMWFQPTLAACAPSAAGRSTRMRAIASPTMSRVRSVAATSGRCRSMGLRRRTGPPCFGESDGNLGGPGVVPGTVADRPAGGG
jgi:hypothetical protein